MILSRPLWCRWKLLIPYLYDWFANHNLTWPSQCCRSAAMAACIASCCNQHFSWQCSSSALSPARADVSGVLPCAKVPSLLLLIWRQVSGLLCL